MNTNDLSGFQYSWNRNKTTYRNETYTTGKRASEKICSVREKRRNFSTVHWGHEYWHRSKTVAQPGKRFVCSSSMLQNLWPRFNGVVGGMNSIGFLGLSRHFTVMSTVALLVVIGGVTLFLPHAIKIINVSFQCCKFHFCMPFSFC
jgi:hypothetical protein